MTHRYEHATNISAEWYVDCEGVEYWVCKFFDPQREFCGNHWWFLSVGHTDEEARTTAQELFGSEKASQVVFNKSYVIFRERAREIATNVVLWLAVGFIFAVVVLISDKFGGWLSALFS